MALWLTRAGRHGEYEARFLESGCVYATWDGLRRDLSKLDWEALKQVLRDTYPDVSKGAITNWSSQLWPFAQEMKPGDWIVLPLKNKPSIAIGEVTGGYEYDGNAEDPFFHRRGVKWLAKDIPRTHFGQDLLYSFGAFMTICAITRKNAEERVRKIAAAGWTPEKIIPSAPTVHGGAAQASAEAASVDLEEMALDGIRRAVLARFKGHGMERLVEALLRAQGYQTYRSPEGADKGVDLLAAPGPLGFGTPRICVQVKSHDAPVDHPTLAQLQGTMQNVHADQGLLVSWGGFKSSVEKERASQFFRIRFWGPEQLLSELLTHYDKLDEEIRSDLPLKRVWMLSSPDERET